jgi:hypothetical protein
MFRILSLNGGGRGGNVKTCATGLCQCERSFGCQSALRRANAFRVSSESSRSVKDSSTGSLANGLVAGRWIRIG